MKYLNCLILGTFLLSCCKVSETLVLQKVEYDTDDIRINGYYFSDFENDIDEVFFLYKDGVFLSWGGVSNNLNLMLMDENEIRDSTIRHYSNLGFYKSLQYSWGVWKVENSQLVVDKWLSGNGGSYPVGNYTGDIINDSAINIAFSYQLPPDGSEKKKTLKFREFSPKPDSTNVFIK